MGNFRDMGMEGSLVPFARVIAEFYKGLVEAGLSEDMAERFTEILVREVTGALSQLLTTSTKFGG